MYKTRNQAPTPQMTCTHTSLVSMAKRSCFFLKAMVYYNKLSDIHVAKIKKIILKSVKTTKYIVYVICIHKNVRNLYKLYNLKITYNYLSQEKSMSI